MTMVLIESSQEDYMHTHQVEPLIYAYSSGGALEQPRGLYAYSSGGALDLHELLHEFEIWTRIFRKNTYYLLVITRSITLTVDRPPVGSKTADT